LTFYSCLSFSQNEQEKALQKWIAQNHIVFNSPTCLDEFEHFVNCNEKQAYRKIIGDTIITYSRGNRIAENIDKLNESIKDKEFNVMRYPAYTQKNGTIVMQEMRKWVFICNQDTLYLLDERDDRKAEESNKLLEAMLSGKISGEEYYKKQQIIENTDFNYKPKFKMIYFKGIFNNSNEFLFSSNQNFRKESVLLLDTWMTNNKKYYKIRLETWTAGTYVISEDFDFINTEICEK
jgi:hypothetical protein